MLTLTVTEIPYALENVANNYSQADRGINAGTAQETSIQAIEELATPDDVGMRFITTSVETTKQSVSTNLENAKEKMEEIQQTFNTITWESEAAEAFNDKLTRLRTSIVNSIDDINTQFGKLMTQTLDDVQAAESSNTVN